MKTRSIQFLLMAVAVLSVALIASCSDDDKASPAKNREDLADKIASAQVLLTTTEEGEEEDMYEEGSQADLEDAIAAATEVFTDEDATQKKVNGATANLQRAMDAYNDRKVAPVQAADLIARWRFDEGTGTTLGDESGNAHNGTLTAGHIAAGGGGIPTWATDRHGNAGKALHFTGGGHILVPASAAFSPTELSISVWVRLDELSETDCDDFGDRCNNGTFKDSYILAQNSYKGYKFQTQDDRYPFFTLKTGEPDTYANVAANNNIPLEQWAHFVVTVKNSEMKFYIDGINVTKTNGEQNFTGGFVTLADRFDFVIGVDTPTAKVPADISWVLAHFEGTMDDLRMYKKVLTPAQVTTIYNNEKPD